MAEGSATTAAAASAPGGRARRRPAVGKEGRGRKAAGGRGERGRAAGGRGGRGGGGGGGLPRLLASVRPALARPLLAAAPRLAAPWPPALAAPPPALRAGAPLPPSSCASASFHTNTNSSPRAQISPPPPPPHSARARPRETSALASARPPSLPLARLPSRSSSSANRSARSLPRPRPPPEAPPGLGTAPARAGWLAARDVSAPPPPRPRPPVVRLLPSAVKPRRNPLTRAALGSGASSLQPPPREPDAVVDRSIHSFPYCLRLMQLHPWNPLHFCLLLKSWDLLEGTPLMFCCKKPHHLLPCHQQAFHVSIASSSVWLMPVVPLPWAEGVLLNVPQPWTMDFQEIGEKLTIITSLPCSSLAARPACYPRSSQHRPGSSPEVQQAPPSKGVREIPEKVKMRSPVWPLPKRLNSSFRFLLLPVPTPFASCFELLFILQGPIQKSPLLDPRYSYLHHGTQHPDS
ncbi:proline-rich protein 36 isoform X1 [Rhinolophus ferrumequinum]|uniref:proline-rich protein 36 isoform X1 n=1 Tax=Rhinolophus ferrumequinum TaxID=59479 RepID=UPI00140FE769|nr:proline-rich protein 36 isoform X1 [Rhinolophus ferrumequinum]